MLWYSPIETVGMLLAAIVIDWLVGDPPWPTHPVILMGRFIRWLESRLRSDEQEGSGRSHASKLRLQGVILTVSTVLMTACLTGGLTAVLYAVHPWLGLAVQAWLISTTIAIKGLKDAAMLVYRPLFSGNLAHARKYVAYIVGRDTQTLGESEITRAAVETVAENTVDAVVSPLFFALVGAAPLAMAYRASNTLDSMVGYRNEKYMFFGWASARWDDVLNWVPARLTALMLIIVSVLDKRLSAQRAFLAVRRFARLHPSPNSGFPESAVAGALGVELGGQNFYGGAVSERARMGWPLRPLGKEDIVLSIRLLYRVSYLLAGGCVCVLIALMG